MGGSGERVLSAIVFSTIVAHWLSKYDDDLLLTGLGRHTQGDEKERSGLIEKE